MEHSCSIYISRMYRRKHFNKRNGDKQIINMRPLYYAKIALKIQALKKKIQTRHDGIPQN